MTPRLALLFSLLLTPFAVHGQAFDSGSSGADGAYNPTASGYFDPAALNLNPAGDNVFHFTTINIPAGVTITMRADKVRNLPVVWLAKGDVTIAGSLVLDGQTVTVDANNLASVFQNRISIPGPGGYPGGVGGRASVPAEAGSGPGGAPAPTYDSGNYYGNSGSYFQQGGSCSGSSAPAYGSTYLVPLIGGSGGSGGGANGNLGGTGGAGGGAIRIVSNTQISVPGTISANGGAYGQVQNSNGYQGGAGSGGAIHLIAPSIAGNGALRVEGGNGPCGGSSIGYIRLNANTISFNGYHTGATNSGFYAGLLYNVPANNPASIPALSITQINGQSVPATPTGSYTAPDVSINTSNAVTVNIAAANIPIGTVVTLRVTGETDSVINCNPLAGASAAVTTATCSATYPYNISISSIKATW